MLGFNPITLERLRRNAVNRLRGQRPFSDPTRNHSTRRTLENNLHVKDFFLDREEVLKIIGKRQAFVFSKFGYAVMAQDRKSQKFRVAPSLPGEAPHAHRPRPYMRKFTFFSYSPEKNSVIIGPYKLPGSGGIYTVPETLEYGKGGSIKNKRWRKPTVGGTGLIRVGSGNRKARNTKGELVKVAFTKITTERQRAYSEKLQEEVYGREKIHVAARPHTTPAFETILPTLPALWTAAALI